MSKLQENAGTVDVSIIIPAYNESLAIADTLKGVIKEIEKSRRNYELIVVNDGSTDGTSEAATLPGVRIIEHKRNRGYGASLKTGTRNATGKVVLFYDADAQFDPADIDRVVGEMEGFHAAIGARTSSSYAPFSRKGGKKLLGVLANYLAKTKIPDLNCGLRAIDRKIMMNYLHLLPDGFSASTTTTLVLLKEGHDVKFVPLVVAKRVGKSTVRPLQDGIDTALLVVRLTTLLDPFRVFGPVSIFLFLFGAVWGIRYLSLGRGLSMAALFLLVSSVMVFFFGLLADQVSAMRRERHTQGR